MDKSTLEARIRQLNAIDRNAFEIYSDLSRRAPGEKMREEFARIARDEKRHITLSETLLELLKK